MSESSDAFGIDVYSDVAALGPAGTWLPRSRARRYWSGRSALDQFAAEEGAVSVQFFSPHELVNEPDSRRHGGNRDAVSGEPEGLMIEEWDSVVPRY